MLAAFLARNVPGIAEIPAHHKTWLGSGTSRKITPPLSHIQREKPPMMRCTGTSACTGESVSAVVVTNLFFSPLLSTTLLYSNLLYSTLICSLLFYSTLLYSTLTLLYSTLSTLLYSTHSHLFLLLPLPVCLYICLYVCTYACSHTYVCLIYTFSRLLFF